MTIAQEIIWREFTLLKEEIETLKDKIDEKESMLFSHEETLMTIALNKDKDNYQTHLERLIKLEERLFEKEKTIYYIKKLFN